MNLSSRIICRSSSAQLINELNFQLKLNSIGSRTKFNGLIVESNLELYSNWFGSLSTLLTTNTNCGLFIRPRFSCDVMATNSFSATFFRFRQQRKTWLTLKPLPKRLSDGLTAVVYTAVAYSFNQGVFHFSPQNFKSSLLMCKDATVSLGSLDHGFLINY